MRLQYTDLQKRVKRIYDTGEAMSGKEPTKTDKIKFKIIYANLEN